MDTEIGFPDTFLLSTFHVKKVYEPTVAGAVSVMVAPESYQPLPEIEAILEGSVLTVR